MNDVTTAPASADKYFATRRIGHVNIFITEYDRSLAFYREVVGLCDGWTRPKIGGGFLNNGYTHHDIGFIPWSHSIAGKGVDGPGLNHLAFEVETEVDLVAGYQHACVVGKEFPRAVDHLVAYSIYSKDPHGFDIEIYADTPLSFNEPDFLELSRASTDWMPGKLPPSGKRNYPQDPKPRKDENAVFHARHLSGAALVSDAYEAAIDYYEELVGLEKIDGGRDRPHITLGGHDGGRDLSIFRAKPDSGLEPGFHHMSFSVFDEDDLAASIDAASKSGITIDRTIDHSVRRGAVVSDPDGFQILFHVDREDGPRDLGSVAPDEAIWLV